MLIVTRLLEGYLLSVNPLDPAVFPGATSVLLSVTILTSYLPARRAAGVSPIEAMRDPR